MPKNQIVETKIGSAVWIDITNPTRKKLNEYKEKFKLHEADIIAAMDTIIIPKTFEHKNYLFIALHAAHLDSTHNTAYQEIDIFFSKRFIITIHNEPIEFFDNICSQDTPSSNCKTTANVLHQIVKNITSDHNDIIKLYAEQINKIEIDIVSDESSDRSVISNVLTIRKDLLNLSNISRPNINVLKEIHKSAVLNSNFHQYVVYFDSLVESQDKTFSMIKHYLEIIDGLLDTINIMVNYRFNDIIKILTIVSVTLLPLTLIAGILGMNFNSVIYEIPYGFAITILLMIILEIIIIQFFKYKKWL